MADLKLEKSLEKYGNILAKKDIETIEIIGSCDNQGILEMKIYDKIELNPNVSHKISLVSLDATSFFPNLTELNNKFYYNNGTANKEITLHTGGYNITDYNTSIKEGIKSNGDNPDYITIELNTGTGRSKVILSNNYKVYFNKNNTWRDVLGFPAADLTTNGVHTSTKIVDVQPTQKIHINCNLCSGTILNGKVSNVLYSFSNNKKFGSSLTIRPNPLIPRKLLNTNIDKAKISISG